MLSLVSSAVVQANSLCVLTCVACSGANELDIGGNNDLDVCLELAEVGDSKEERGEWSECCCSTSRHTAGRGCITSALSAVVSAQQCSNSDWDKQQHPQAGCGGRTEHAGWILQELWVVLSMKHMTQKLQRLVVSWDRSEWVPA